LGDVLAGAPSRQSGKTASTKKVTNKNVPAWFFRLFPEGGALYTGAGFGENTHVQIAIRNPDMIKGYFLPRKETKWAGTPLPLPTPKKS
jgi:hypothetical protein